MDACHAAFSTVTQAGWLTTAHATAIETSLGPDNAYGYRNEACYNCHGVGRTPVGAGGFISLDVTPQFGNIQCESCHGTGVGHPANGPRPKPWDPATGYLWNDVTLAWEVDPAYDGANGYGCGLCHEGSRHGAFKEWAESLHATFALLEDGEVGPAGEANCVKCHNGQYYVAIQIRGEAAPTENLLPEDMVEGMHITCATCHDPHNAQFEAQLRVDSTVDQIIPMGDVPVAGGMGSVCVSCHNGRRTLTDRDGSIAGTSSRGMHGNAQGALLYGLAGLEFAGYTYDNNHPHATWNENACVTCHMYRRAYIDADNPTLWGHNFEPRMERCITCHTNKDETTMVTFYEDFQAEITALLVQFEETWPVAWKTVDDTIPAGDLGHFALVMRDADPSDGSGPPREDPAYGNLYREVWWNYSYIMSDASTGVHNPTYAEELLQSAITELEALNLLPAP
jgi:hypothetical protein